MKMRHSRPQGKLTNGIVRGLHPLELEYKTTDGGGLHVAVTPAGRKCWRLQLEHEGKQRTLSLGEYPAVKIEVARALREEFLEKCRLYGWKRAVEVLHERVVARRLYASGAEPPPEPVDTRRLMAKMFGLPPPSHSAPESRKRRKPPPDGDPDYDPNCRLGDWDGRKLRANPDIERSWQQKKSLTEFPAFTGRVTVRRRKTS